jgi:hypothetical protein
VWAARAPALANGLRGVFLAANPSQSPVPPWTYRFVANEVGAAFPLLANGLPGRVLTC